MSTLKCWPVCSTILTAEVREYVSEHVTTVVTGSDHNVSDAWVRTTPECLSTGSGGHCQSAITGISIPMPHDSAPLLVPCHLCLPLCLRLRAWTLGLLGKLLGTGAPTCTYALA